MFQYSIITFTKGSRGNLSALKGLLYIQHLSRSDKPLQYFFFFLPLLHHSLFSAINVMFLPESMVGMVIKVESYLFEHSD